MIMKNKYFFGFLFFLVLLSVIIWQRNLTSRNIISKEERGYYLSNGTGIYAMIENDTLDNITINLEISQGNARKIKEQYEDYDFINENLEMYAAIQNIVGIAEVYIGEYRQAYARLKDTIDFIEDKELVHKDNILVVLYNNVGAMNLYYSHTKERDEYLEKAYELCQEPYMSLVIQANQSMRIGEHATRKQQGIMLREMEKLIKAAKKMEGNDGLVQYVVERYLEGGYMTVSQEERAIKKLNEYIIQIPDLPEYNMIKTEMLGQLGYGYNLTGEYDKAIQVLEQSITTAQKTVDENSQELAREYGRLAKSYGKKGEWEIAREYLKKMIPGCKEMLLREQGMLYFNIGHCSWEMEDYEESKRNYFKSYICYCLYDQEIDPEGTNFEYSYPIHDYLEKFYKAEEVEISYAAWMEKEMMEIGLEPDQWLVN